MISIKNPLNTQLLIGDVYVRCEIKFLPLCPQNAGNWCQAPSSKLSRHFSFSCHIYCGSGHEAMKGVLIVE